MNYAIIINRLSIEDGGGFLATVPDLPGCQSDGETEIEAIENVNAAMAEWIECYKEAGREVPVPGSAAKRISDDRKRLVNAIIALSDGYEGFDQRLEAVEASLNEIKEEASNTEAWHRFANLAGLPTPEDDQYVS